MPRPGRCGWGAAVGGSGHDGGRDLSFALAGVADVVGDFHRESRAGRCRQCDGPRDEHASSCDPGVDSEVGEEGKASGHQDPRDRVTLDQEAQGCLVLEDLVIMEV